MSYFIDMDFIREQHRRLQKARKGAGSAKGGGDEKRGETENQPHTPGPWRVGRGRTNSVVADAPAPGIGGSDDVTYYGGHLIAESVNAPNALLIAAAPDLLASLQEIVAEWGCPNTTMWHRAKAAIERATGAAP